MHKEDGLPVLSTVADVLAIPYNLLAGLILGLIAPIAAIVAMIAGVRLLTGKMPFVSLVRDPGQERSLALTLVPPEKAGEMFAVQKEEFTGEISRLQKEIRAIVEEAKAEAGKAAESTQEAAEI